MRLVLYFECLLKPYDNLCESTSLRLIIAYIKVTLLNYVIDSIYFFIKSFVCVLSCCVCVYA